MELDLKDYLKILKKRFWILALFVAVGCSATGVVSYFLLDPVYEASSKLIVNKHQDVSERLDLNSVNLNIRLIETYKEIIKTTAIMDKVVARYPELGTTSEELIKRIRVSSVNNTQVMTVSIQDKEYNRAVEIVNAVATVFKDEIPSIMTVDNVSVLDTAKPMSDPSPVRPNPPLNIAISFVVSLMVGVGLAFLLEYLDDTIKTRDDVQKILGLPTLAMIPRDKQVETKRKSTSRTKGKAGDIHRASSV